MIYFLNTFHWRFITIDWL